MISTIKIFHHARWLDLTQARSTRYYEKSPPPTVIDHAHSSLRVAENMLIWLDDCLLQIYQLLHWIHVKLPKILRRVLLEATPGHLHIFYAGGPLVSTNNYPFWYWSLLHAHRFLIGEGPEKYEPPASTDYLCDKMASHIHSKISGPGSATTLFYGNYLL